MSTTYTIPQISATKILPRSDDYLESGGATDGSAKILILKFSQSVSTLAALKALDITNAVTGQCVLSKVGGIFFYDSTSTATPDDITVVQPNSGSGRWLAAPGAFTTLSATGDITATFAASGFLVLDRAATTNYGAIQYKTAGTAKWIAGLRETSDDNYHFYSYVAGSNIVDISPTGLAVTGDLSCTGALSKGSGSFRIDHPLPEKRETHQLVHSFIEGPKADLIYRGKVSLVAGQATINIDSASTMAEGTFVALCRDVQCFTTNESGWTPVRGSVSGNILTILSKEENCSDEVSWMVIGERKDQHMMETDWTDENGRVIVEPLKPEKCAEVQ